MKQFTQVTAFALCLLFLLGAAGSASVLADTAVVRAVLFHSPTCPHCQDVIDEDLPPLLERYGRQLRILGINVREQSGQRLYQAAIRSLRIPEDRQGVPTLVIGDVVLVGSDEIPQRLPGLVEQHLVAGGSAWPAIPGLATSRAGSVLTAQSADSPATPVLQEASIDWRDRLARDPLGNGLAIVVLLGMLILVGSVLVRMTRSPEATRSSRVPWLTPLLALIGLSVAIYLGYVETAQIAAVCGPVGDCNTVQQSEYARIMGIPMGLLGVAAYAAILLSWLVRLYKRGKTALLATRSLFVLTFMGTLFSIYLTFLEPFVIGATCAWCLASAVIMSTLLWLNPWPRRTSA